MWSRYRNKYISSSDGVIYECKMFQDHVSKYHPTVSSQVIYLGKEDYYAGDFIIDKNMDSILKFAYVGSINNIIDINLIVNIIKDVGTKRNVELVVIGGGENEQQLSDLCKRNGVVFNNYGIIYDDDEKHKILKSCHFGLNIMKNNVAVGATMKSLEYFHEGLIIVNNISADTETIINNNYCGYNINENNYVEIIKSLQEIDNETIITMMNNSRKVYDEYFNSNSVDMNLISFIKKIVD